MTWMENVDRDLDRARAVAPRSLPFALAEQFIRRDAAPETSVLRVA